MTCGYRYTGLFLQMSILYVTIYDDGYIKYNVYFSIIKIDSKNW